MGKSERSSRCMEVERFAGPAFWFWVVGRYRMPALLIPERNPQRGYGRLVGRVVLVDLQHSFAEGLEQPALRWLLVSTRFSFHLSRIMCMSVSIAHLEGRCAENAAIKLRRKATRKNKDQS